MVEVLSFQAALDATEGEDRTLLIGNGFSAEYFSYGTLLSKSGIEEGTAIKKLFSALDTVDFEAVVRALDEAAVVERAYGNSEHSERLSADAQFVREALVRAITSTHPGHREELDVKYESSATFLGLFGKVFSLNYDLLLYWVNLEKSILKDGFGKAKPTASGRFRVPFLEDAYCDIYNLHGGLHLFQDQNDDLMKALNTGDGVISTITSTIINDRRLPVYVAEGTSAAKMRKINSVGYLRHCYSQLLQNSATVFVYGHSADDNDAHIYRAIFSSPAKKVYFGAYRANEDRLKALSGQLARHHELGGKKVEYAFFDAETAHVWDAA